MCQSGVQVTSSDCTDEGSNLFRHQCFYDDQWNQAFSCQSICDGTKLGSFDEVNCEEKCPGMFTDVNYQTEGHLKVDDRIKLSCCLHNMMII